MKNELKEILEKENFFLNNTQIDKFIQFAYYLKEWNKNMNLTALKDDQEIIYKHFLDSLLCLKTEIDWNNKKINDVGTGAGFPGIPLKIALDNIELTLFDSLKKRIIFLEKVVEKLSLKNVVCTHGRAEDLGRDINFRNSYDIVLARAVARLPILLELCLPLVKVGGYFIALKGPEASLELEESKKAIEILGAEVVKTYNFNLPDIKHDRVLIVFKNNLLTPDKYPRKAGIPQKRPLL